MSPVFSAENRGGGPVDAPADTARRCACPDTCCCRCSETPSRPRNPWPRGLPARRAQRAPPRTRTGAGCPWAGAIPCAGWPALLCPALPRRLPSCCAPASRRGRPSLRADECDGRRGRRALPTHSRWPPGAPAAPSLAVARTAARWPEPIQRLPRPCYLAPSPGTPGPRGNDSQQAEL